MDGPVEIGDHDFTEDELRVTNLYIIDNIKDIIGRQ